ncbi:MAG: DUF1893 domain-containing protein [candidate division KSB1 bacterium]|nr:DUF1893 domain-containing protein [candidate division KSB1 bacterium]MDZ7335373.1 DUF1893 domain-containing protein [candidate division KSB1 bacterium]MDZ7357675.1 DUF1893 domain-containing protein [candidate division KSB1 bacterium]
MQHTLEAYLDGEIVFYSDGKWLYPLFELEEFIDQHQIDPSRLLVVDKIVGRAAALIQLHFGIRTVRATLMSRLALELFHHFHVNYQFEQLVDRIQCRTEELLKNEYDPDRAYQLIYQLAYKKNR